MDSPIDLDDLVVGLDAAILPDLDLGGVIDVIFKAANLIDHNEIDHAIDLLEMLDDEKIGREDAGFKHLHLAIAYRKKKITDRMDSHWRKAIEFDHPTGMAYEKLAISLTKQGRIDEAIEVCEALIRHPTIPQERSYLTKEAMRARKEKLEARRARAKKR